MPTPIAVNDNISRPPARPAEPVRAGRRSQQNGSNGSTQGDSMDSTPASNDRPYCYGQFHRRLQHLAQQFGDERAIRLAGHARELRGRP